MRGVWLVETPEERVRQEYLCTLVNEYGYKLEQIAEEVSVPSGRGAGRARADFLIWRTPKDKTDGKTALLKPAMSKEIVKKLERYNLSDTSEAS